MDRKIIGARVQKGIEIKMDIKKYDDEENANKYKLRGVNQKVVRQTLRYHVASPFVDKFNSKICQCFHFPNGNDYVIDKHEYHVGSTKNS